MDCLSVYASDDSRKDSKIPVQNPKSVHDRLGNPNPSDCSAAEPVPDPANPAEQMAVDPVDGSVSTPRPDQNTAAISKSKSAGYEHAKPRKRKIQNGVNRTST